MEPYIRYLVKSWTPVHNQLQCSLKFTFDPSDFIYDASNIVSDVACEFDRGFKELSAGRRIGEAESDGK